MIEIWLLIIYSGQAVKTSTDQRFQILDQLM